MMLRLWRTAFGRWENIESLMAFDSSHQVPSTFFVGIQKGRQLAYTQEKAAFWIRRILSEGFDVGVHGIEFENTKDIGQEHGRFLEICGQNGFGVRMHCLARDEGTLNRLAEAEYSFDSSVMSLQAPYRIGRMWELPLQLMDGDIICGQRRWQSRNLCQAKVATLAILDQAIKKELPYFNVLFHDVYYSDGFRTWKKWYEWLVDFLMTGGYPFISFKEAVQELEQTAA